MNSYCKMVTHKARRSDRANQFDINQNMTSDKIEEGREKMAHETDEKQKDRDLEEKLKNKEFALKKLEIKNKPKPTKG